MRAETEWTIKDLKKLRDMLLDNPRFNEEDVNDIVNSIITVFGRP